MIYVCMPVSVVEITYPLCMSGSSIGTQELACNTALVMAFFWTICTWRIVFRFSSPLPCNICKQKNLYVTKKKISMNLSLLWLRIILNWSLSKYDHTRHLSRKLKILVFNKTIGNEQDIFIKKCTELEAVSMHDKVLLYGCPF